MARARATYLRTFIDFTATSDVEPPRASSEPPPLRRSSASADNPLVRRYLAALENRAQRVDQPQNVFDSDISTTDASDLQDQWDVLSSSDEGFVGGDS